LKNTRKNVLLVFITLLFLISCGPAEIGFSTVIIKNDNSESIKKVEIDNIEIKDIEGNSLSIEPGDRMTITIEFITGDSHDVTVFYSDGEIETISDKLSVMTNSTNSLTFGVDPPQTSTLVLLNKTGSTISAIYFCSILTETPIDDFNFIKIPNIFTGGLTEGSTYTTYITSDSSFYIYTETSDNTITLQGSIDLNYDTSETFTASN